MALEHSNGSPLIHHVDKADRFTDPHLRTYRFMIFPENGVEAETRMGVLPSEVSQVMNERGDHWFTQEAVEKMQQITWEEGGGFTTDDDKMLQEIAMDNFRVTNMEDTEDMSMDTSEATSVASKSL